MKYVKENFYFWLIIFSLIQGVTFGQLSSKDGETYTTEITVKFKTKAFDKIDTKGFANLKDIKTDFKSAKNFLSNYGKVQFRKSFIDENWGDTIKYNLQGKAVKVLDLSQFYSIMFPEPVKMWETVYALRKLPEIESADPPVTVVYDIAPNDQYYQAGSQWYLSKIQASSAWDITTGSSSIIAAVIDNGVNASHADLSAKITGGESGYSGGTENHGSRVAGVLGLQQIIASEWLALDGILE